MKETKMKEPNMKFVNFGAFQNFKQMLSHDKIIFHMLFGAFHVTPRITVIPRVISNMTSFYHIKLKTF